MIKRQCKECPWKVKSSNNTSITTFAKKHNKQHNCHMVDPSKRGGLWDVKEECMCAGSRKQKEQWNQESELDSNTKTRKE